MSVSAAPVLTVLRLLGLALVLALAVPSAQVAVTPAHAQQQAGDRQSGGGLLRFLFPRNEEHKQGRTTHRGAPQVERPASQPSAGNRQPKRQQQRQRQQRQSGEQATASAPVAPPAAEKAEDARRLVIIGDFLAGGLAEGLTAAFAERSDLVVIDRSNGSSGLVRDDYYDWPGQIGAVLEEAEPAVVVVMIGANDRQQMRVEGTREQPRSPAWTAEYERRVTTLAKAVLDKGLPLVWVGSLPFKSHAMSSDILAFNDIYRRIVSDAGGEFVDVWDGFVDENGAFVTNGPDMNGQPAHLRASDGINVTRQGRRKIAFYAEKPLNRILDAQAGTAGEMARLVPGLEEGRIYGPHLEGAPATPAVRIDRTAPVAIDDPDLDGGSSLLGASFAPGNGRAGTLSEQLSREDAEARPGRADDFTRRRPPQDATGTDPEKTTALTP